MSEQLPTFTAAEVASHNSRASCYVTLGKNVYDMTDFVEVHPGGAQLVLDYAGKDVGDILKDPTSHTHTEAAYEMLDESLVGYLAGPGELVNGEAVGNGTTAWVHSRTGMSCEEDLSKETDYSMDYKKHKFLDLSKPLLWQIWFGGFSKEFYLDQVHRPRHYKGGESAPIFGNILEPFTKTSWWAIPTLWLPQIAYLLYRARPGFNNIFEEAALFGFGVFCWTLIEYILHRFLFHLDYYLPDNRLALSLHFLLHGVHHYLPMDKYRLVMPPALLAILAVPFYRLAHTVFYWDWSMATAAFCGGLFGYVCYDCTHYVLHFADLPLWYKDLKKYHLEHHFLDYELGFGVTSRFWDVVFGTALPSRPLVKAD